MLPLLATLFALDTRQVVPWRNYGGVEAASIISNLTTIGTAKLAKGESRAALSPMEVQRVLPEAVKTEANGSLTLDYQQVFVLGLRATQHLAEQSSLMAKRVQSLEGLNTVLMKRNERLELRLGELERRLVLIGEMLDYRESVRPEDEPTMMRGG